jgi:hypothetical protein
VNFKELTNLANEVLREAQECESLANEAGRELFAFQPAITKAPPTGPSDCYTNELAETLNHIRDTLGASRRLSNTILGNKTLEEVERGPAIQTNVSSRSR